MCAEIESGRSGERNLPVKIGDSAEIIEQFRVWLLDNAEYMQKDIFLAIAVHAEHRCAANMLEEIEKQKAE